MAFTETNRTYDLPRRIVTVTVTDSFGASQDIQIAVARDGCPMCGSPYIKTPGEVVDVDATVSAIADAQDVHTDNALASFQAAGADVSGLVKARSKKV